MGKIAQLNHLQESANRSKNFILNEIAELSTATAADISVLAEAIEGGAGGGGISYAQITKLNATAGKEVDITINRTTVFNRPPVEILKFEAGTADTVVTACEFNNGDADDFNYDSDSVVFDGYMSLKTSYDVEMTTPVVLESGYLSTSENINTNQFKSFEGVNMELGAGAIGVALVSTGGRVGTWARIEESGGSMLLIGSDSKVYSSDGTQIASDWNNLSSANKVTEFSSAADSLPAASLLTSLGSFTIAAFTGDTTPVECTFNAIPFNQVIKPKGLINIDGYETINSVTVTDNKSGSANIRILVTPDLTHYYTYKNSAWQEVDITSISGALTNGMTSSELAAINADAWASLIGDGYQIGFAYALSMETTSETCNVDAITLTVDLKGVWKKAIYGTDVTYGYNSNTNLNVKLLTNGSYKINYVG